MTETDTAAVDDAEAATGDEASSTTVLRRLHPIGWVAVGFAVFALIATAADWDLLAARMPWWLWVVTVATIVVSAFPPILHRIRLAIEAVSSACGTVAIVLAWFIFVIQLFNVITRYTNDWFERDILFGETTSLAWMSFAALFLLGAAYGVKNGINPRIDFWWAEFSPRRKAWIDFVLHTFLFLPFLIVAIRVLKPFAARSLGYNRFANDGAGEWPEGWAVWRTWETSTDAGQLPQGPIQAFILVGVGLWTAQVVAEIIKTGFVINGRRELGDVTDADEAPLRIE
ncbi:MAG: TRAP transporter small permease subunit [Actinomycetota bacterium]